MSEQQSSEAVVYVVRCNFFGDKSGEEGWNEWYNGPKMDDMLSKPLFVGSQRFLATGLETEVRYVAVWQLQSEQALATPEYKQSWGFADWVDLVGDWSRDLFAMSRQDGAALVPPPGGSLVLHAFRTSDVDRSVRPGALWLDSIGLDGTWPLLCAYTLDAGQSAHSLRSEVGDGVLDWETRYTPLIEYQSVARRRSHSESQSRP